MRCVSALLVAVLALGGCADGADEAAPPPRGSTAAVETSSTTIVVPGVASRTVSVYFIRDGRIAPAERSVKETHAVGTAALRELIKGPTSGERAEGFRSFVLAGTRLLSLSIADGLARVEMTPSPDSTEARAQVVHTLTQFDTVRAVVFGAGGRLTRRDFEDVAPAILVESPAPGADVASPLRVSGTANTFEATLFLRIVDETGRRLVDQLVTATSGSGERGTFEATLRFRVERAGPGTLVGYERSAEDGSEIHVVRIPLLLHPG